MCIAEEQEIGEQKKDGERERREGAGEGDQSRKGTFLATWTGFYRKFLRSPQPEEHQETHRPPVMVLPL